MKKGLLIKESGVLQVFDYTGLESLQEAVGGNIEVVSHKNFSLFVNEEGKLLDLPPNEIATEIVKDSLANYDFIAGDAVLLGGVDDEGETLGLSDEEIVGIINAAC